MSLAYLNGKYLPLDEASISPMDRGFLFGDAVYEVIPFYNGKGVGLTEHLERLHNSLAEVEIVAPLNNEQWCVIFTTLLADTTGAQKIYLQVSRGTSLERTFSYPAPAVTPTVFAYCTPFTPGASNQGLSTITIEDIRWRNCYIKSNNLLASCMATDIAKRHHCQEVIMHRDGDVTEGGSSNVFVVKNGTVLTTPASPNILNGITRQLVLKLIDELNISAIEANIPLTTLTTADEIWITSSTREVAPIIKLNDQPVGAGKPGAVWQQVYNAYCKLT